MFPLEAGAQTISTNTFWEKGVYKIEEDLIIEAGAQLTIQPGSQLLFTDGRVLQVAGDLVVGSNSLNGVEKVTFEGAQESDNSIGEVVDDTPSTAIDDNFIPAWSIVVSGSAKLSNVEFKNSTQGLEAFGGTVEISDVQMHNLGWCFNFDHETKFKLLNVICDQQTMSSGVSGDSEGSLSSVSFSDMKNSGEILGLYNSNVSIKDLNIKIRGRQKGVVFNRGEYSVTDSKFYFGGGDIETVPDINNQARGIVAYKNTQLSVASSTVQGLGYGIHNFGGEVKIASSTLEHNDIAVFQTPLAQVSIDYGVGGDVSNSSDLNDLLTLSGSRILSNTFDIKNDILEPINAQGVWWGGLAPKVEGVVKTEGSLSVDPWSIQTQMSCCSSVVFIPGFQASQLGLMNNDNVQDVLWVPHNNGDVRDLFLSTTGESKGGIHAFEILNSVFGKEYYAPITHHLNSLVDGGVISSWADFPYDWRYSMFNIKATSTEGGDGGLEKLRQLIVNQSKGSRSGKVTLIAHSNGGLVVRALVAQYPDISAKIESVVYVGVPHSGTPKAIASLLHGAGESLLAGILMRAKTARDFGLTLPGAFGLLPHPSFFNGAAKPVITFSSSTKKLLGINQDSINQAKALDSFLTKIRTSTKDATQLNVPSTLSSALLGTTRVEQNKITVGDKSDFKEYSIYGIGLPTIETLAYKAKEDSCKVTRLNKCNLENLLLPTYQMSQEGDGTVLSSSASRIGIPLKIDLTLESKKLDGEKIDHATLFKSPKVRELITKIIEQGGGEQNSALAQNSLTNNLDEVSEDVGGSENDDLDVQQIVSIHSPVELHVYDGYGNHTGPQVGNNSGVLSEDFLFIDEEIPGSVYIDQGHEASIYLSSVEPITIELIGTDVGNFSLDITTKVGDKIIDRKDYIDVSVVVGSQVQLELKQKLIEASSTVIVATEQAPQLKVDIDADGKTDSTVTHDQKVSRPEKKKLKLEMLKFIMSKYFDARFNKIYLDQFQLLIKKLGEIKKEKFEEQVHSIKNKNEALVLKSFKQNKSYTNKTGNNQQYTQQDKQKIKNFIDVEIEQLIKSE